MILFIDTEWADVLASELVSLALVSDCGRYEFYAERDPLPDIPTDFVRAVVYPLLDRSARALGDDQFTASLHTFFNDVLEVAPRGKVLVAYDHRNDMALLEYALDGFESPDAPPRPPFNTFNLGLLGHEFDEAVEAAFSGNPEWKVKRHHALTDARANREAFLWLQAVQIHREVYPLLLQGSANLMTASTKVLRHLRTFDPEMASLLLTVFGDERKAATWCVTHSRVLGAAPVEALSAGRRGDVLHELRAIQYGIPV